MPDTANSLADLDIRPTGGALGAEIRGVDLRLPLPADTLDAVRRAFLDHCLICFRDQQINEADQVRFTRYFGEPVTHVRKQTGPKLPEIMLVSNIRENGEPIGALGHREIEFHSDLSYMPKPGTVSMLYAVEVPDEGGATHWCNGYAAYEALDKATKTRLIGLRSTHLHFNPEQNPPEIVDHPIVCTHPDTGRKTLYISPYFSKSIVGMADDEGHALLSRLFAHQTRAEFIWTHRWRVGDLVMWDNRATMHRRDPFPADQRRLMKRTQIFNETVPVA